MAASIIPADSNLASSSTVSNDRDEWTPVPEFPDYEASRQGKLRHLSTKQELSVSANGVYLKAHDKPRRKHFLHIWIALTFVPNPDPVRVVHVTFKDGTLPLPQRNYADNLMWGNRTVDRLIEEPLQAAKTPKLTVAQTDKWKETLQKYRDERQTRWLHISATHGTRLASGCLEASEAYKNVRLGSFSIGVHRLALLMFNDVPVDSSEEFVVRHKCGNNKCFEHTHLEFGKGEQNSYEDRLRDGTLPQGESHKRATITEEVARQFMTSKLARNDPAYLSIKARADRFGVSERLVQHIDSGTAWAHLRVDAERHAKTRAQARKKLNRARNRIWTDAMFVEAGQRVIAKTTSKPCTIPKLEGDCQIWSGQTSPDGYGTLTVFSKQMRAHVVSLEASLMSHRPADEITRHLCGNKLCCNPAHLRFGTASENGVDAVLHGHKGATITVDTAREIHNRLSLGDPRSDIAEELGVSSNIIDSIAKGRSWQHAKN